MPFMFKDQVSITYKKTLIESKILCPLSIYMECYFEVPLNIQLNCFVVKNNVKKITLFFIIIG